MSGAVIYCANCRKVFSHQDDHELQRAFTTHNCSETKRLQTLINNARVSNPKWVTIQSSFTPDGAA